MKTLIVLCLALIISFNNHSQSIFRNWHSELYHICWSFKEDSFSMLEGIENYKVQFNERKKVLTVYYYPSPFNSRRRYRAKFKVLELTNKSLILEPISERTYLEIPKRTRLYLLTTEIDCYQFNK